MDVLAALAGRETRPAATQDGLRSLLEFFTYNGTTFPVFPYGKSLSGDTEPIGQGFPSYVEGAYRTDGVVFAVELVRMHVFAEARPVYRKLIKGRPGELFTTPSLKPLEQPSPGMTGRKLRLRAITDADLAGNFFAAKIETGIIRLRPDWITVLLGSELVADDPALAPDVQPVGYLYHPGGPQKGHQPIPYRPNEVVHWAPTPDPLSPFRGMSWLTPVLRDVMADKQAVEHKQKFFDNGATPNMVVTLSDKINPDSFQQWVDVFNDSHQGAANAYKTLFLGGGADIDVVGKDFQQLDFKNTQGAGETRIAAAGGIHPTVIGLSEGMQGSSLNSGNYQASRRATADKTFRPLWADYSEHMQKLVAVPRNAELWYDDRHIEFLQEDKKDNAEIQQTSANAIRQLVDAGYEAESVVAAIVNDDMTLLQHSGLFSVQLQPPGTQEPTDE